MSPLPMRRSAPGWSSTTRLSASDETANASREGMLALMRPGDHVHRRPLGGQHQVDADSPGHLGYPADRLLDVASSHHHQVVELVDDDQYEGQALIRLARCRSSSTSSPRSQAGCNR